MEYRVIALMFNKSNHHGEKWNELKQYLQVKRTYLLGLITKWETIETEDVPSFAWMQHGTLGSTDWKSKFSDIPNVKFIKTKKV